jgi:hypothetical protein
MAANPTQVFDTFSVTLPPVMRDMSDKMPIPDNQYVFTDISDSNNIGTIIIELAEPVESEDPVEFCFKDLAEANGATESKIVNKGTIAVAGFDAVYTLKGS